MKKVLVAVATCAFAASGLALASPASAAPKNEPVDVTPRHAPCGTAGPLLDGSIDADAPVSGAVNQRSGTIASSPTNCTIVGQLQATDDARYYCYTVGNDGFTWTYLQNTRTGVRGWSRDNLLDNFGSGYYCGF
ncbi:SH3 domain-containing protein [Actinophytocola oryzae]|uniref:SH3 domain-containing protein n=1 Tax=Actinophytocola oryzae TaxID=502181 RepID=A0A4V6Q6N0_9PSEU|nr:SH3 domain-containing protein [Actinophytocola oryzae]TDV44841.1 hypothetical protein CLV71_113100 [Actinophytocola oryzae]